MDRQCEIWSASTDLLRPAHAALLDDRERARAERLSRPEDRARTVLAAALVRLVGARALHLDPVGPDTVRRLDVDRRCPSCAELHGKPSIGNGVHLSVSHAGELVMVAVSRVAPVGVDVEPATRGAHAQVAARWACAAEERAQIADARDALRYWIRKEAIVKATGEGLAAPLADVRVSAPREPARFVGWTGRPDQVCTLIDLNPPDGYVASLAVLSSGPLDVVELTADHLLAA
jgi:4'-phosphopantetheinyl transferase